jgi:hypothetical protein
LTNKVRARYGFCSHWLDCTAIQTRLKKKLNFLEHWPVTVTTTITRLLLDWISDIVIPRPIDGNYKNDIQHSYTE